MNSLAAFFACNISDEDSFWMFVYLYERRMYKPLFKDPVNMNKIFYIFDKLSLKFVKKVRNYLIKEGITNSTYLTEYFITLYSGILPFEIVARIFDIFIYENEKILYRAALAILSILEKHILDPGVEMKSKFSALKKPKIHLKMTADEFITRCHSFKFSQRLIDDYARKYLSQKD